MPKTVDVSVICDFCEKDITKVYSGDKFRIKITYEGRISLNPGYSTLEITHPPLVTDLYFCNMKCCSNYFQLRQANNFG